MPDAKYLTGIETAQDEQRDAGGPKDWESFDFDSLAERSAFARWKSGLTIAALDRIYAFSRRFKPLFPLAGLLHVTREAQVREILLRHEDFITPFGPEMDELGDGATFLLGLEGPEHDRLHTILRSAFLPQDAARIGAMSAEFTDALLDNSAGEIDVIADLIKRVPTEICLRYFGLHAPDPDLFGDYTVALSNFLFGDPYAKPEIRVLAMKAKRRLAAIIDDAIVRHRQVLDKGGPKLEDRDTLVERFLLIQRSLKDQGEQAFTDQEIRAMLMGLATGFVPTNTLGASNMLLELLDRPEAMAVARKAAREDDAETMRKVVLEAGRLNPTLAPGQWRYCPQDTTLEIDGETRRIAKGTTLLVSTMSALRDPRAWEDPNRFRLDRTNPDGSWKEPDLVFGIGPHACLGKHLAMAQISALFSILLKREGLVRAPGKTGKLVRTGPFPRHLVLRYASTSAQQSMFLVIADVEDGVGRSEVDAAIGELGHPANEPIRSALHATGLVHFSSLSAIESEQGFHLVFELSCDGSIDEALQAIAAEAGDLLRPVFAHAGLDDGEEILPFLRRHMVDLHGKMWGATGLNFNGLSEFPVARVAKERRFADFAGRVVRDYVATETARGSHPMLTLNHMRQILCADPLLRAEATPAQIALMDEAARERFDALHLTTDTMRLALSRYRKPASHFSAVTKLLASRDGWALWLPTLLAMLLSGIVTWKTLTGSFAAKFVLTPLIGVFVGALILAGMIGLFAFAMRRAEKGDVPSAEKSSLGHMQAVLRGEDHPGYAHNHFLGVSPLKPGIFRTFLHAFALWGNRVAITYWFRPGLILNMGTIHYARWFRIPGTRIAGFFSNFDGSWENYLEDFIVRTRWGQSAVWSNWQGFPETHFLAFKGAEDSDAFKRYTRKVQQVVPFWYSRFPDMTSDQMRNNGLIHVGAGLAQSSTESEEWVRCFGSMPRSANLIETDEVQALVFRGMKRLPYSAILPIALPPAGQNLNEWLCWLRGRPMRIDGLLPPEAQDTIGELVAQNVIDLVPRSEGQADEYALSHALSVAFGDRPLIGRQACAEGDKDAAAAMGQAVFFGLAPAGMAKFDRPDDAGETLLDRMPNAYRMGMAARSRVVGDADGDAPSKWRWHDDAVTSGSDPVEAVLMLYADSPAALEMMLQVHKALLANHGGALRGQVDCGPAWEESERVDFEHFGFRDGISQPVIRGTSRSTHGVPARDVAEPGEYIIGYPNNSGYYPKSPTVSADADVRGALPVVTTDNLSRFPDFGDKSLAEAPRDLGRNGTFLVLRELAQDVDGFHQFAEQAASDLNQGGFSDLYKLVGQRPDADWVKAKMMGRWPDGRPLIGNPVRREISTSDDPSVRENDFSYGSDDPQGLACPFGSHVRRTNPRDSKLPGDEKEEGISNRHRILRRGRPYRRAEDGEKGLMFACLCTDIERQFEFVQQIWANAPSFHGLDNEPDPIVGACPRDPVDGSVRSRCFTIPTPAGPIRLDGLKSFVQVKAGGYFFMPSRSALGWLSEQALHCKQDNIPETSQ